MEWLNYHHLYYFWAVARAGTVAQASRELRLAQPTISGQIRLLEEALDEKLFTKVGRNLALTETGRLVYRYADEIFGLGRELLDTLRGRPTSRPARLLVGISDVVPKLLAHRLLEPALRHDPPVQIVCREDKTDRLLAELSIQGLDLVLADAPIAPTVHVRAYNHLLGESAISFFAPASLKRRLSGPFPQSLDAAPMLLPTDNTLMRRSLDQWLDATGLRPLVVAEFEDSALMKVFGQHGEGIFPAPTVIEAEICRLHGVTVVGRANEVKERIYAITVERRIKNPAVMTITESARKKLLA